MSASKSTGRPALLDMGAMETAHDLLKGDCGDAEDMAQEVMRQSITPHKISGHTILRAAYKHAESIHKTLMCVRGKPRKQIMDHNMEARLSFVEGMIQWTPQQWQHTMFTEQTRFEFQYHGTKVWHHTWVRKGDVWETPKPKHPYSINLYVEISPFVATSAIIVAGTSKHNATYKMKGGSLSRNIVQEEYMRSVIPQPFKEGTTICSKNGIHIWTFQ